MNCIFWHLAQEEHLKSLALNVSVFLPILACLNVSAYIWMWDSHFVPWHIVARICVSNVQIVSSTPPNPGSLNDAFSWHALWENSFVLNVLCALFTSACSVVISEGGKVFSWQQGELLRSWLTVGYPDRVRYWSWFPMTTIHLGWSPWSVFPLLA